MGVAPGLMSCDVAPGVMASDVAPAVMASDVAPAVMASDTVRQSETVLSTNSHPLLETRLCTHKI